MTYDIKCLSLACDFIGEVNGLSIVERGRLQRELAYLIQRTIEDFIAFETVPAKLEEYAE